MDIRLVKIELAIVIEVDVRNVVVDRRFFNLLASLPRAAHSTGSFLT